MNKLKSPVGSSINANRHPYAKNDFEGTDKTQLALANIKGPGNSLPLMSNEDFYAFCTVRRILLEQPYLSTESYSKAMRIFMDGWLEEQLK